MRPALATALFLALPLPVLAQDTAFSSTVYSQIVTFTAPSTFEIGFEQESAGSYILELVQKGETVDGWTQLITLTGGEGLAAKATVQDFANMMADGYGKACPDSFTGLELPTPSVPSAAEIFAAYLGCGDNGEGNSEAMVFLILRGRHEIYTLQWAERGAAQPTALQPDPAHWQPRLDALASVMLADPAN